MKYAALVGCCRPTTWYIRRGHHTNSLHASALSEKLPVRERVLRQCAFVFIRAGESQWNCDCILSVCPHDHTSSLSCCKLCQRTNSCRTHVCDILISSKRRIFSKKSRECLLMEVQKTVWTKTLENHKNPTIGRLQMRFIENIHRVVICYWSWYLELTPWYYQQVDFLSVPWIGIWNLGEYTYVVLCIHNETVFNVLDAITIVSHLLSDDLCVFCSESFADDDEAFYKFALYWDFEQFAKVIFDSSKSLKMN